MQNEAQKLSAEWNNRIKLFSYKTSWQIFILNGYLSLSFLKKKQFHSNLKAKLVVLVALTFSLFPFVSIGKEVLLYLGVFNLKRVLRTACREKETRQTTAYWTSSATTRGTLK